MKKRNGHGVRNTFILLLILAITVTSIFTLYRTFKIDIDDNGGGEIIDWVTGPQEIDTITIHWPDIDYEILDSSINYDGTVDEEEFIELFDPLIKEAFNSEGKDYYNDFGIKYEYEVAGDVININCESNKLAYNNNYKLLNTKHTYKYKLVEK